MKKDAFSLALAAMFLALVGACCNPGGASAEAEALEWAERAGLSGARAQCAAYDSDGDGYVSCTVSHATRAGEVSVVAVDCPGKLMYGQACRLQRPAFAPRRLSASPARP